MRAAPFATAPYRSGRCRAGVAGARTPCLHDARCARARDASAVCVAGSCRSREARGLGMARQSAPGLRCAQEKDVFLIAAVRDLGAPALQADAAAHLLRQTAGTAPESSACR